MTTPNTPNCDNCNTPAKKHGKKGNRWRCPNKECPVQTFTEGGRRRGRPLEGIEPLTPAERKRRQRQQKRQP